MLQKVNSGSALPHPWLTLFQNAHQHEEDVAHIMKIGLNLLRQVEDARIHTVLSCKRITAFLFDINPQLQIEWSRRGSCACGQLRGRRTEGCVPSIHWLYVDRRPSLPYLVASQRASQGFFAHLCQRMTFPATRPRSPLRTMRAQPVLPAGFVVTKRPLPTCSHR